jgi:hypothetical protein
LNIFTIKNEYFGRVIAAIVLDGTMSAKRSTFTGNILGFRGIQKRPANLRKDHERLVFGTFPGNFIRGIQNTVFSKVTGFTNPFSISIHNQFVWKPHFQKACQRKKRNQKASRINIKQLINNKLDAEKKLKEEEGM